MPDNVAASMTASIVLDKSDLLAQILKGLSEGQKELQNNKLEMYFDFSNSKNQAEFEKVIQKYRKQLSSQEFVVQIKDQGIDETVKSLDKLVEIVKSLASGKAFGTGSGNGKGIGNSIVDERQLKTVINLFEKMESHLGSMRKVISDVGDGDEFSPLLTMINKVDSSISELAKKTSSLSLNMNLDFGSDDKITAEVQSRTAKLLHTYENLFNRLKMSGTLDSNMQGYFDNFDINQYDNMNAKIAAYKNFITEMREMSKQQFGKDYLYSDIEKSYYSAVSGAQRSLNNVIKSESTSNNSIENLFGKTDLSEVISQLTIIVNKLDEISTSANNFTNVFKNGLDVNTSIQEVIDLTNRVKELEIELAKIKNVTPATVSPASETNISSGMKDAFHSDIDTSSSVKSLENLEEEIKKIFTDANELQNILDSLHNGKYFHLSWTTDGIDETGADGRVRQLSKLLEEYGYTINNFKSDSDAFDTSGVINAIKEENNVLEQNTQKVKENTQAKEQNANANLNKYDKRLDSYNGKIDKYQATIDRFNDGGWTSDTYLKNVQAVRDAVKQYATLLDNIKTNQNGIATDEDIQNLDEYEKKIKDTIATVTNMSASEKGYSRLAGQKEIDKINKILRENSAMSSEAKAKIKAYKQELISGNPSVSLEKIHGEILKIVNAEELAGRAGRSFFDTLKNSGFHQLAAQMAGMFGFYDVINLGKKGFNVVRELNTALTEMRKVSNETVQSLKNYQATTFDTADAVGTTAKQIQNSTADWMRLGESMDQAAESAKDANVLFNVSEFEGIDEATESLVSMSQAYKDLDKMDIIDVLNNIGNNYSISTDGLATALKDSASALVTANNDLNEAVSLTTAGNAITQDPSKVGAGLRTISLRLVGTEEAKEELSDLGEETDGMITTVSKLRDTIMDATKAASSDGKGFDILDSNGNYKSTYEIMQGLADLYDDIVKKDKELGTNNLNLLLETIAGKNRSNIAASILQNGDMLRSVYEDAQNSEGSAEKELNSYLDSIDGKMAQLENRAQEFWFKVIDSETIKNGIDLLSTLLKGATDFVDTVGLLPTILTGVAAAFSFKNVGIDTLVAY
jgi:TP901 family phage tail tape measure protein|uniref:Minor tail protein n=1 Tax=Siphoviridae sp. cttFh17 TaxID=2826491 RepID=A0A8S5NJ89_9CAUD|nr:MAG TPA: minor tail protein [Siphoviridae sp. cttFh17]